MMVFGKQNSAESVEKINNYTSRPIPVQTNERRTDDISSTQESSSSILTKLLPIQPDNIPMNLISRYETMTSMNRIQTVVRLDLFKILFFSFFFREHQV
jgi:hypothetical protein